MPSDALKRQRSDSDNASSHVRQQTITETKQNLAHIFILCVVFLPYLNEFRYVYCIQVSGNGVIAGSGNGLAPDRRQANTWTNAELLSTKL